MMIKNFLLALAVAIGCWCAPAQAANYYYSNCGTGADVNCVNGSDANTPCTNSAAPCQTFSGFRTRFNNTSTTLAGDNFYLARGGAWDNFNAGSLSNSNASAANPITIGSYTPTNCTGACLSRRGALLNESRAGTNGLDFPGATDGIIIEDLVLNGNGTAQYAIFMYDTVSDFIVRRVEIYGFGIGVHCGENNDRIQLLNSNIHDNYDQGTLWGCDSGSLIEGNTFTNNGTNSAPGGESNVFLHNVYVNCGFGCSGLTIRFNVLTQNSILTAQCRSPSMVVHGQMDDLVIEYNLVYEATGAMKTACNGIVVDPGYAGQAEGFRRLVIRGNTAVNMGNAAIGCTSCVDAIIELNVVILEQPTGSGAMSENYGIAVPNRDRGAEDLATSNVTIRNNSYYASWTPADASCINISEYSAGAGATPTISSNACYFGIGVNSNHHCFDFATRPFSDFTSMANNGCYHAAGNGRHSVAYASLANAQAAGFDIGGLSSDPLLAATPSSPNWRFQLQAGSPWRGQANSTYKSRLSIGGGVVTGARDMGAYQYGVTLP